MERTHIGTITYGEDTERTITYGEDTHRDTTDVSFIQPMDSRTISNNMLID